MYDCAGWRNVKCAFFFLDINVVWFVKRKKENASKKSKERRKWIHVFDNASYIIFAVSLVGYDQTLAEDNTQNRIAEALALFYSIVNMDRFKSIPFFLVFTKKGALFFIFCFLLSVINVLGVILFCVFNLLTCRDRLVF